MGEYYVLNENREPVATDDVRAWGAWFADRDRRRVAYWQADDVEVSTVFIGLNHQWGDGPPLLFETMVFGGKHDDHTERCSTWAEAEAQHASVVAMVAPVSAGETET